jgi:hypothetical protein
MRGREKKGKGCFIEGDGTVMELREPAILQLLFLRLKSKEWDPLTIDYFDNFNNESLNKYKNILKMIFFYKCIFLPFY